MWNTRFVTMLKDYWSLLRKASMRWRRDRASHEAAAVAFYTVFSLAPLAIVAIGMAGILYGHAAARGDLVTHIEDLVGPEASSLVQTAIQNAGAEQRGVVATSIGFAVLLIGATKVFTQLQATLNDIWKVKPKPGKTFKHLLRHRLLSFGLVISIGFLLLVSLVVSALLSSVGTYLGRFLPENQTMARLFDIMLSLTVISFMFAAIFRYLPDVQIPWRGALSGGILSAVLFTAGKFLIGLYLGRSTLASTYGAAGSLVILLIWVYYSAQILLFGAEFTWLYIQERGLSVTPAAHAEFAE